MESLQIEALYEHAIMLQSKAVEEVRQDEGLLIPNDIDYSSYVYLFMDKLAPFCESVLYK